MVRSIADREKRGIIQQKVCVDTYERILRTITRQLFVAVREFPRNWPWNKVTVTRDELSSTEGRDILMRMSTLLNIVRGLLS